MAIVIVGGGAIGLQVAGRLALSGVECAVLARPQTVDALLDRPLSITLEGATRRVNVDAATSPDDLLGPYRLPELAIVCVKGYDTPGVIPTLRALNPGRILTLQNGIGNEELLAEAFGQQQIIAGSITTSVELPAPTEVVVTKAGGIGLAGMTPATRVNQWSEIFTQADFPVELHTDYRSMKWSKALLNMLGNAQAAILDMPVPEIYANSRLVQVDLTVAYETLAVMGKLGIHPVNLPGYPAATIARFAPFTPGPILRMLMRRMVGGGRGGKDPSLLRDLRAGRTRSEGEQLYGAVAAAATTTGMPVPVTAGLWRILGAIVRGERPWQEFRRQPERLLAELGLR